MISARVNELTGRVRDSRFGREVLGPKVAEPLAGWLTDTFVEPDPSGLDADAASLGADAASLGVDAGMAIPGADAASLAGRAGVETVGSRLVETIEPEPTSPEPHTDGSSQPADRTQSPGMGPVNVVAYTRTKPESGGRLASVKSTIGGVRDRIKVHNLVVVAAGIAFWALLAIPALLFSVVSIAGLVVDPETIEDQAATQLDNLPPEVSSIIGEQLENVSSGSTGGLVTGLVVSLVLSLWTASGAMAKMIATLNTIYGVIERRRFFKLRGLALVLTLGGVLFVVGSIFLLAVLPPLLANLDLVGESIAELLNWLRFPTLALVMVVALGVLYHVGPDRRSGRYRVVTGGAVVATVLWVGASALFSFYTTTLASYNETYGSLGGLVMLLLWLFLTAFVVLVGAEIHALRTRPTPSD